MTIKGTVDKTALSLVLLIISAYYTYTSGTESMILIGSIGGLVTALITILHSTFFCSNYNFLGRTLT